MTVDRFFYDKFERRLNERAEESAGRNAKRGNAILLLKWNGSGPWSLDLAKAGVRNLQMDNRGSRIYSLNETVR